MCRSLPPVMNFSASASEKTDARQEELGFSYVPTTDFWFNARYTNSRGETVTTNVKKGLSVAGESRAWSIFDYL